MTRLLYIFICFVVFQTQLNAQASINDYKYIIVPKQLDFLSSQDQFQTSSLTKFLFNKYGYTAFFDDDDLPEDLSKNRCLGLRADIKKNKGFLITKLQIDLLDCNDNIVMSSLVGETKIKEYKKAYPIAIREAFVTYQFFNYKYVANDDIVALATSNDDSSEAKEIEKLKKEVEALKVKEKQAALELEEEKQQVAKQQDKVVEAAQELFGVEVVESVEDDILYAQPIENGFQIVDTQPKKVMILLNTGTPDVFIVKGKDAIVYKKNGSWIYALNSGNDLKLSDINLKF
jgi:hypothetical protein|nr:hypothetical protein [uncultured Psychroserpens sp.]